MEVMIIFCCLNQGNLPLEFKEDRVSVAKTLHENQILAARQRRKKKADNTTKKKKAFLGLSSNIRGDKQFRFMKRF